MLLCTCKHVLCYLTLQQLQSSEGVCYIMKLKVILMLDSLTQLTFFCRPNVLVIFHININFPNVLIVFRINIKLQ